MTTQPKKSRGLRTASQSSDRVETGEGDGHHAHPARQLRTTRVGEQGGHFRFHTGEGDGHSAHPARQCQLLVAHAARQLRTTRAAEGDGHSAHPPRQCQGGCNIAKLSQVFGTSLTNSERSEPATDRHRPHRSPAPNVQSRRRITVAHAARQL